MNCWHPTPARSDEPDSVRRWAELEGKSATMQDELYQSQAPQPGKLPNPTGFICILGKLIAAIVESWSHIHSR
jgi:hypothetical protein